MPTFPFEPILKREAPDDDAIAKGFVPAVPVNENDADGVVEPIPRRPLEPNVYIIVPVDEAITNGLTPAVPVIARLAIGVEEPIPTLPFEAIVKSEAPDDEATLNGFTPDIPCTLNEKLDEVALIPATVPLSRSVDVPSVVGVSQRVANPRAPPVNDDEIPNDEVATHCVDVPVDQRTCPRVPEALVESRKRPERVRLVAKRLLVVSAVADAVVRVV
jgi:hypothetical protein